MLEELATAAHCCVRLHEISWKVCVAAVAVALLPHPGVAEDVVSVIEGRRPAAAAAVVGALLAGDFLPIVVVFVEDVVPVRKDCRFPVPEWQFVPPFLSTPTANSLALVAIPMTTLGCWGPPQDHFLYYYYYYYYNYHYYDCFVGGFLLWHCFYCISSPRLKSSYEEPTKRGRESQQKGVFYYSRRLLLLSWLFEKV